VDAAPLLRTLLACPFLDVNVQAADGCTCLHRAAEKGRAGNIAVLLENNQHAADVNVADSVGDLPLHKAIRGNHLEVRL
jgi:ankyrin repeat protein